MDYHGIKMVYEQDAVVIEIKADFDPFGGEYTLVSLGYKIFIPRPPEVERMYPLHQDQLCTSTSYT